MIVDTSMFVGDRAIPNTGDRNVMDRLNWFINKYEPRCLKLLLGDLYPYTQLPYITDSPMDKLINGGFYTCSTGNTSYWDGLAPLIVDYVYYNYMRDDVSATSGKGVIIARKDMAFNLSPATKLVDAWNEFVHLSRECYAFLTSSSNYGNFPQYTKGYAAISFEVISPINEFDI